MTELESPETFAVDRLGVPEDCRRLAGSLIEARENAVRIALLAEIEAIAKSNDARNEDFAYLIRDAVDELSAKYTKPKES